MFFQANLQLGVVLLMSASCLRDVDGVHNGDIIAVQGQAITLSCLQREKNESVSQVSWKRKTRKKLDNHYFFTIRPSDTLYVNGFDARFKFIGNLNKGNGSLQLFNVTLEDEGLYTCSFTLFPSGDVETQFHVTVNVPPVTRLKHEHLVLGNENVTIATCFAADSKPPAQVEWQTGVLKGRVKATINTTPHLNGTATTVSSLIGVPTQEMNNHTVHCVITNGALSTKETLSFTVQVNFPPVSLNISGRGTDSLECASFANPTPKYTWSRSELPLPESVQVDGPTLTFLRVASDLNGLYFCEASNAYGSTVGQIYVHFKSGSCTVCWLLFIVLILIAAAVAVEMLYFNLKHCPRYLAHIRQDQPSPHASPRSPLAHNEGVLRVPMSEEDPV